MGSDGETSSERPGRRTDAERQAIVAEAFKDGHSVSEVADRHGVSTATIYLWRRQVRETAIATTRNARKTHAQSHPPSPVRLVPVRIAAASEVPMTKTPAPADRIEIALANGRILRVCEAIDPVKLMRLVAALESIAPLERAPIKGAS